MRKEDSTADTLPKLLLRNQQIWGDREEVVVEAPVVYRDGRRATVATKIKVVRLE
jgi:hypothetical protein